MLLHGHFFIGKGRKGGGTPAHHPLAPVNQTLFVEIHKDLLHTAAVVRVHGETGAAPITRAAQLHQLLDDDAAVLFLPLPDLLHELLAAQVVPVPDEALFLERAFDDRLGGDAGMVGAGEPEDLLAAHARLAGEDVLDGVVEDVAHGEHAGDVGRRDDHRVGRAPFRDASGLGEKELPVDPVLIPLRLHGLRVVGFG